MPSEFECGDAVNSGRDACVISGCSAIPAKKKRYELYWKASKNLLYVALLCENAVKFYPTVGYDLREIGALSPSAPVSKAGAICSKCGDFFPWAENNQKDGTMICWSCRAYPSWSWHPHD